jgi:hypothetical protein
MEEEAERIHLCKIKKKKWKEVVGMNKILPWEKIFSFVSKEQGRN